MLIAALVITTTAATYYYNREQDRRRAYYREKIKNLQSRNRDAFPVLANRPTLADEGRPERKNL